RANTSASLSNTAFFLSNISASSCGLALPRPRSGPRPPGAAPAVPLPSKPPLVEPSPSTPLRLSSTPLSLDPPRPGRLRRWSADDEDDEGRQTAARFSFWVEGSSSTL
ncbi:unnamed protein product, partial [Ectocarpus sp. 12 AP-2014]